MTNQSLPIFFLEHGRYLSASKMKRGDNTPFGEHPDLAGLISILSRKYAHHVILRSTLTTKMHSAFLEALFAECQRATTPTTLRHATLYYLDTENEINSTEAKAAFHTAIKLLVERLDQFTQHFIFVATSNILTEAMLPLLLHPKCHFILFVPHASDDMTMASLKNHFTTYPLASPTDNDIINLLKQHRVELENFHDVFIPEELLAYAYAMTARYISVTHPFDHSLLLLDSSAARAGTIHLAPTEQSLKPVLTIETVNHVLSTWTKIPSSYLNGNHLNFASFTQGMQAALFGQDAAIHAIGKQLQQAQLSSDKARHPLCQFLFVGSSHVGKKTAAVALANQLFGATHMFYLARITERDASLLQLKMKNQLNGEYSTIKAIMLEKPYAILCFENMDAASPALCADIDILLKEGKLIDDELQQYHFQRSCLIFMTTAGAECLDELNATTSHDSNTIDLMQLVMKENQATHQSQTQLARELVNTILPNLYDQLPNCLLQVSHIIPFIKPQKSTVERILREQCNLLCITIQKQHGIAFDYTPEVIRYLANIICFEASADRITIHEAIAEARLVIEKAIYSQPNDAMNARLRLQLNETGQALRCTWQPLTTIRQHTS